MKSNHYPMPALTEKLHDATFLCAQNVLNASWSNEHMKRIAQIALAVLTAEKRLTVSVVQKNERLKGFNFDGYDSLPAGEHEFYTAPPAPVIKSVVAPDLPADCDRTEAHFKYQAAIRTAGYEVES
ncbi:hypothetical protein CBW22_07610 [Pantoea sp. VS1]|uniref:hypothetical protein n=1 Tax=Pantoea sp. VS1 TaxID=2003658 RepID=UPI000B4FF01E|nr:hypothetical protein [Pantoea sp. VS1]OWS76319.1 hypothetical protein CBW22_07610 [Pantoea sp. VS1]